MDKTQLLEMVAFGLLRGVITAMKGKIGLGGISNEDLQNYLTAAEHVIEGEETIRKAFAAGSTDYDHWTKDDFEKNLTHPSWATMMAGA